MTFSWVHEVGATRPLRAQSKTTEEYMEISTGLHNVKFQLRPEIYGSMNLVVGNQQAGLIDTGTPPQPDQTLLPYLQQIGLEPSRITAIVNTHWHGDHMGGNAQLVALTRASVAAHRMDAAWIERPIESALALRQRYGKYHPTWGQAEEEIARTLPPGSKVDRVLEDGDQIEIGERAFRVVHTPGHTPGSISLFDGSTGTLFAGDALQGAGQRGGMPVYTDLDPYLTAIEKIDQLDASTLVTAHIYPPAGQTVYQGREVQGFLTLCRETVDRLDAEVMESLSGEGGRPRTLGEVIGGVLKLSGIEGPVGLGMMCVTAHLERLAARGAVRRLPPGPDGAPDEATWAPAAR